MYAQHGRDVVGCKSPVFSSSTLMEVSIPNDRLSLKLTRGEGNCGAVRNRGEEACECAGKLAKNRRQPHSRQDPPGYAKKLH